MITIDDKLELFKKVVLQRVVDEFEEKFDALETEHDRALKEFEKYVLIRKAAFIQQMEEKAQGERKRLISQAKSVAKNQVLHTRHALIDELIDAVKDRIHIFVESEIYTMFLQDNLKATLEKFHEFDDIIVELTQHDHFEYGDMIENSLHKAGYTMKHIKLVSTEEDIIGGFVVYNGPKSVRIDFSLAAVISDNKRFMGQLVYEILNEAGDANEQ